MPRCQDGKERRCVRSLMDIHALRDTSTSCTSDDRKKIAPRQLFLHCSNYGHPALMHFLHSHQSLSAPCLSRHTCTSVYIVHGGCMPQCCDPQGYGRYDSMDGIGRVESGTETEQLPRWQGAAIYFYI